MSLLLTDIAIVSALGLLGALITRAIAKRTSVIELIALGFPLGAGTLTFAPFLLLWAGAKLSLPFVAGLYLLAAVVLLAIIWRQRPVRVDIIPRASGRASRGESIIFVAGLVIFALLTLAAAYISVGRAHSNYDTAAMWAVKGYGLAMEQDLFEGAKWGGHGLSYPLNIQLLVSFFKMADGDQLPGSQLIFTAFQASALLGCCAYWLRKGVPSWMAGAGLVFMATIPVLFIHATIGFANLAMALYIALGTAWGIEGIVQRDRGLQVLGSLMLGFGSWTILEGFIFASLCLAILLAGWIWIGRKRSIGWLVLPMLTITGVWLFFYSRYGASGSQAAGALNHMLTSFQNSDFNLVEIRMIFGYMRRYLFHIDLWGLVFIIGPIVLILGRKEWIGPEKRDLSLLAGAAAATGVLSCLLFYLRSFEGLDLFAWLVRGFPRQFLATALLFGMLVFAAAGGAPCMHWSNFVGKNAPAKEN